MLGIHVQFLMCSSFLPFFLFSLFLYSKLFSKFLGKGANWDLKFSLSAWGLAVCLCIHSHLLPREASMMMLDKALTYKYSRISLGIIFLLFILYFLASHVWLYSWYLGCIISVSLPSRQSRSWLPSHGVGLRLNQTFVVYSHKFCATIAPEQFAGRTIVFKMFQS